MTMAPEAAEEAQAPEATEQEQGCDEDQPPWYIPVLKVDEILRALVDDAFRIGRWRHGRRQGRR